MLTSIKNAWASFEAWVHSWWPGAKTKIVAALGAIGNAAYFGQDYLQQLTGLQSNVITGSKVIALNIGLFTLAYWFRGLGDRVNARLPSATS